jgi:hypothetical protein
MTRKEVSPHHRGDRNMVNLERLNAGGHTKDRLNFKMSIVISASDWQHVL